MLHQNCSCPPRALYNALALQHLVDARQDGTVNTAHEDHCICKSGTLQTLNPNSLSLRVTGTYVGVFVCEFTGCFDCKKFA
jgi:hypothetical protein